MILSPISKLGMAPHHVEALVQICNMSYDMDARDMLHSDLVEFWDYKGDLVVLEVQGQGLAILGWWGKAQHLPRLGEELVELATRRGFRRLLVETQSKKLARIYAKFASFASIKLIREL